MPGGKLELSVSTLLWMLIVAFIAMMVVRRVRLPYTIALVIAGLVLGAAHLLETFHLSYELVFTLFLPALLFDAAIRLPVEMLKRNWVPVALLAVPGVILSTFIVGYGVHVWGGVSLMLAFLFGALISATDPISVLAIFKSMGVDRRLAIIVEGESLFNDGTSAVLYRSILAALLAGTFAAPSVIGSGFLRAIAGGVIIGGGVGWGISLIMARLDDHLAEITLTTIAAYGASLLAESFGTSGVISVISSGVVLGYYRGEVVMSATTRAAVYSFWEYIAFVINSILFILIGIDVTFAHVAQNMVPMGVAIGVVILARAFVVYFSGAILSRSLRPIPLKWLHVINFGGFRGALAIALALGIPRDVPGRDVVLAMTYAVVLWTLLPQGLSMGWVFRRLGLAGREAAGEEYGKLVSRLLADRAGLAELHKLREQGIVSQRVYTQISEKTQTRMNETEAKLDRLQDEYGQMASEQMKRAKLRMLAAQQNAVRDAADVGIASESAARELIDEFYQQYEEGGGGS